MTQKKHYVRNLIFTIALAAVILPLLGRAVTPVSYAAYYKHDLKTMRDEGKSYELIFIGASRVYRSFDPAVFQENTEYENVLNASSVAQTIEGSYYLAKELISSQHPKMMVLGVSYNELLYKSSENAKGPRGNMVLYDRLEDPSVKLQFLADVMSGNDYLYLSNLYRYGSSISLSYLKDTYEDWKRLKESNYAPVVKKKEYYAGDGFVYSKQKVKKGTIPMRSKGTFDPTLIDPDKMAYLDKIVALCKDNGVELKLVTPPTSLMMLYNVENYQGATDFFAEYAQENGLSYHNLSMLKTRFKYFSEEYLMDYNHVNGKGAEYTSKIYSEIINREAAGESTDDLFYDDVDEIKEQVDYAVAVRAVDDKFVYDQDTKKKTLVVEGLCNDDQTLEFQIRVKKAGGERYEVVYDYTEDTEFDMTKYAKAGNKIAVYTRVKGHDVKKEAYQIYTVNQDGRELTRNRL